MKHFAPVELMLIALGIVLMIAAPAYAQFTSSPPPQPHGFIDVGALFGALAPFLNAVLQAIIPLALTWIAYKIHQWTGAVVDKNLSDRAARVLQNEAASLIADGQVRFAGAKVEVDSKRVADAANAVITRMPELQSIGFTPELVAHRIVDAVPQVPAGAAIIAQQHAKTA